MLSKRFLLIALATIAAIATLLLIGLNAFLGLSGIREQAETTFSREWGVPVKIGGVRYWPWSGLEATGLSVTVQPPGSKTAPSSITLPSVSAKVAVFPLFSGHVVINRLLFADPSLTLVEMENGGWILPIPDLNHKTVQVALPRSKKRREDSKSKPERAVNLDFRIQKAQINNATFRFIDKKGNDIALFEGVILNVPLETLSRIDGNIGFRKAALNGGYTLEDFSAPFQWNGEILAFSQINARLAGGSLRGKGAVQAPFDGAPFTLDLLFDGVEMQKLLTSPSDNRAASRPRGAISGNLDLYGVIGKKESIRGVAYARMRGGRMEQIPLLQMLGKILPIEELRDVEVRQAQIDLRADDGKVFVDSLVMESPNLSLTAKGTSDFDGKLDLAARLAVNAKVSRQLPGWVDANFQPVAGSDRRDIGFKITGTLAHPKTDLMEAMMGQKIGNQIKSLWQSLTGKPKKKTGEKKKGATETPASEEADPAPTPAGQSPPNPVQ